MGMGTRSSEEIERDARGVGFYIGQGAVSTYQRQLPALDGAALASCPCELGAHVQRPNNPQPHAKDLQASLPIP